MQGLQPMLLKCSGWSAVLQMDHLACFLPANLALGVAEGAVRGAKAALYAEVAANLTYTCWQMYARMPTGTPPPLMPVPLCYFYHPAQSKCMPQTILSICRVCGVLCRRTLPCVRPLRRAITCGREKVCHRAGLAPEAVNFDPAGMTTELEFASNKLRPEAVEALWHMWRLTGHPQYREWGWQMFEAFQEHSRGPVGYHNIKVSLSSLLPR